MSRLFFALEIACPWPQKLPKGRYLQEQERHMTLAFLGEQDPSLILEEVSRCNFSSLQLAPSGIFDSCLFLPTRRPATASWHVTFLTQREVVLLVQKELMRHFLPHDTREFLPHVTIARSPFTISSWKKAFTLLPCYAKAIHLYESIGNLRYTPIYTIPLQAPFEEIEHTADIAFCIRGKNIQELYFNAVIALSFVFTGFVEFFDKTAAYTSLDEVICSLNTMIAHADSALGCPVKAVSFHGDVKKRADDFLQWEMIVDV